MKLLLPIIACLLLCGCSSWPFFDANWIRAKQPPVGEICVEQPGFVIFMQQEAVKPTPKPVRTDEEKAAIRHLVDECLCQLESPDWQIRLKAYNKLCQQDWDDIEPYLPCQGSIQVIYYLKRVERMKRPAMHEWFQDYIDACERFDNWIDYDKIKRPSHANSKWFAQSWAERRPASIFDPCQPEPVKVPLTFEQWR